MKLLFAGKKASYFVLVLSLLGVLSFVACPPPPSLAPSAVTDLVATAGDASVSLTWAESANDSIDYIELVNGRGIRVEIATGKLSYGEAGLVNGVEYEYTLRAVGLDGLKSEAVTAKATPVASPYSQTITGRVTVGEDIRMRGVRVTLLPTLITAQSTSRETITDAMGEYRFAVSTPGEYTIMAEKKGLTFTPTSFFLTMDRQDVSERDFSGSAASGYLIDAWGNIWDAIPRAGATYAIAKENCEAERGRLPTPTEIYRNSHNYGKGLLRGYNETAFLWTAIEYDLNNQVTVNAAGTLPSMISSTAKTSATTQYRCMWPNIVSTDSSPSFEGGNINTEPGEDPFELTINGVTYVMDTRDRAPLWANSAIRECEFYGGFLPSESFMAVAIQQGLPNGTGQWLQTSSYVYVDGTTGMHYDGVKWTGTEPNFSPAYPTNVEYFAQATPQRFRGAITKNIYPKSPATISERKDFSKYNLSVTGTNSSSIGTHLAAVATAYQSGGHIPNFMDYHAMITAGLQFGSGPLWTSNYMGAGNIGCVTWGAEELSWALRFPANSTWLGIGLSALYRVVYYPINEAYTGPAPALVPLGVYEYSITLADNKTLKVWIDQQNRTAASLGVALKTCHELGGHLASQRDLLELIQSPANTRGLPGGTGLDIWTSDPSTRDTQRVMRWGGNGFDATTNLPTFTNTWGTSPNGLSQVAKTGSLGYRCVWTNEVRVR